MISITFDNLDTDRIKPSTRYETLPVGNHEVTVVKNKAGAASVKLVKNTQADGSPLYSLSFFYTSTQKGFSGINFNLDVLGVKNVVGKRGDNAGKTFAIDMRANLFQYLLNYGFAEAEAKAANIVFTALEDEVALDAAGFKGVPTDILVNGQSISDRLTSTPVIATVEKSAKGKTFIKSISAK